MFKPADQGGFAKISEIDVRNRCNRANHHSDEPAGTFCWPTVQDHLANNESCTPGADIPHTLLQLTGLPFCERCGSGPPDLSVRAHCLARA